MIPKGIFYVLCEPHLALAVSFPLHIGQWLFSPVWCSSISCNIISAQALVVSGTSCHTWPAHAKLRALHAGIKPSVCQQERCDFIWSGINAWHVSPWMIRLFTNYRFRAEFFSAAHLVTCPSSIFNSTWNTCTDIPQYLWGIGSRTPFRYQNPQMLKSLTASPSYPRISNPQIWKADYLKSALLGFCSLLTATSPFIVNA